MSVANKLFKTALFYFMLVAVLGTLLRFSFVFPMPFTFKHVLHAHSHVAFFAWVFLAFAAFFYKQFLSQVNVSKAKYAFVNIIIQITFPGMLLTFIMQGYGVFSIIFSTLFMLAAYVMILYFYKDVLTSPQPVLAKPVIISLRFALFYFLLSTLGIWGIGPAMVLYGKGSDVYQLCVHFFLHFQYNGWMVMAVLALFFNWLQEKKCPLIGMDLMAKLMGIACMPAFFITVLWIKPLALIHIIALLASGIQVFAMGAICFLCWKERKCLQISNGRPGAGFILVAIFLLFLKSLIQSFSAIPGFFELFYANRHWVVAFLHLVLIGVVSLFILGYSLQFPGFFSNHQKTKWPMLLFLLAFLASECWLLAGNVLSSMYSPLFHGFLSFFSLGMCISLVWLFFLTAKNKVA